MIATHTIGVRHHEAGATDAHGNQVDSWSDPIPLEVYSIAPATSAEPFEPGREAVITGLTVLAPNDAVTLIGPRDRVVVNGEEYTVEGDIADWGQGPFGWSPGISFNLERVEG